MELLHGLDVLLLDCLRIKPHSTHFGYEQSVSVSERLGAKKTFFIHMTHDLEYESLENKLPDSIFAGYDGLKLTIN